MNYQDKEQTEDLRHARMLQHDCWLSLPEILFIDRLLAFVDSEKINRLHATILDNERPEEERLTVDINLLKVKMYKYSLAASARCAWKPLKEEVKRYNDDLIGSIVPAGENPDEYGLEEILLQKDSDEIIESSRLKSYV